MHLLNYCMQPLLLPCIAPQTHFMLVLSGWAWTAVLLSFLLFKEEPRNTPIITNLKTAATRQPLPTDRQYEFEIMQPFLR